MIQVNRSGFFLHHTAADRELLSVQDAGSRPDKLKKRLFLSEQPFL